MVYMNNITDMSVGSPTRHLLAFTVPLLIGNLFQQFYNMVDSLIVGNFVGANALAAVGTCGSLCFLFFALTSGLAIGIGIIVSQYFGAKNEAGVRVTIANSFFILTVSSVVVTAVGIIFCRQILHLINCPESVFEDACTYLSWTCWGIIFIAFYNGIAFILRALGDSRTPLYFLILASIINVVLDLLFVVVFKWGVFGVSIATVISQAVSAVINLIYAFAKIPYFRFKLKELYPNMTIVCRSIKIGVPMALQNALIAISCIVLQGVVNSFGETVMAAFTISNRIEQLVQQPYSSLGTAITTFSGQNFGAGNMARVKKGMHRGTVFAAIFSLLLIPIVYIWGRTIVSFFVKDEAVIEMGYTALRITCLFYFPLGMIYVPRSTLNGCGDAAFAMMNGMTEVFCRILFAHVLTKIAAVTLFGKIITVSYWGIWITTDITWAVTALVCIWRYKLKVSKRV